MFSFYAIAFRRTRVCEAHELEISKQRNKCGREDRSAENTKARYSDDHGRTVADLLIEASMRTKAVPIVVSKRSESEA